MQDLKVQFINAIQDDKVKTVKAILALGIDLTQTEDYAPLALACMHCRKEIIFSLLYYGADLFAFTPRASGSPLCPLIWLIIGERKDIFKILFKIGYLDPYKHGFYINAALEYTEKPIARYMSKFFVNRGVQCHSFIPSYAYDDIDYEEEYECDNSVFLPYAEKKEIKMLRRSSRLARSPTPIFESSSMLK
jgi:hypothetical protein